MTGRQNDVARRYDELLVVHVQSGDRRAAELLVKRWQPRLSRTAMRLLQDREQAQGAVQDTWASILKGISGLRDPARFGPWSFGILRRRCADTIREASQRRGQEQELDKDPVVRSAAEERLEIGHAFARLPADQRLAAQLFFIEGFALAEIAEVQDVPIGTAKSRLFHARQKLKAALSDLRQGEMT